MKVFYILALIGIIPISVIAQVNSDTLKSSVAGTSHELFQDSIAYNSLLQSKQSVFYLKTHIPARYSRAGINYQLLRGNFIAAQDANQIQLAQLSTEGSSELGKVKLFGSLTYSKVFEDSTSFGHQTRNNTSSPYYFGTPAKIHYERTTYAFQAMAGRSYWNEKIDLSLGLDYKVGSHFSTNDPRGSLSEYQFDLQFITAYNLNKDLALGMGYSHGYGRESVNIGYKNPRYYESSAFPEFYNHLVNGYREWDDALRNRIYDNKFLRHQVQLGLDYTSQNFGKWSILGRYESENQSYFLSNNTGFTDLSFYDLKSTFIQIQWDKKSGFGRIAAFLNWENTNGKDLNVLFQANNYLYTGDNINFKLFIHPQSKNTYWRYYLIANKKGEQRLDGISGNEIAYQKLWTEIGITYQKSMASKKTWGLNTGIAYQFPLSNKLIVPLASGSFTQGVIMHDYNFHQATLWSPKLNLSYSIPTFKNMVLKMQAESRFLIQLTEVDNPLMIEILPIRDRFVSKFSLNLYF